MDDEAEEGEGMLVATPVVAELEMAREVAAVLLADDASTVVWELTVVVEAAAEEEMVAMPALVVVVESAVDSTAEELAADSTVDSTAVELAGELAAVDAAAEPTEVEATGESKGIVTTAELWAEDEAAGAGATTYPEPVAAGCEAELAEGVILTQRASAPARSKAPKTGIDTRIAKDVCG